jgi:hypothetical protein
MTTQDARTYACCPCCLGEDEVCMDGYHDDHEMRCENGYNNDEDWEPGA